MSNISGWEKLKRQTGYFASWKESNLIFGENIKDKSKKIWVSIQKLNETLYFGVFRGLNTNREISFKANERGVLINYEIMDRPDYDASPITNEELKLLIGFVKYGVGVIEV